MSSFDHPKSVSHTPSGGSSRNAIQESIAAPESILSDSDEDDISTIPFFHENPLRDPLAVGSEIANMRRAPALERTPAPKVAARECESFQLPMYDYSAQPTISRHNPTSHHQASVDNNAHQLGEHNTEAHTTGPQSAVPSSHLPISLQYESMRSIGNGDVAFFPPTYYEGNLKCLRIGAQRVSMRMPENYLNATEICAASVKDARTCRRALLQLRTRGIVVVEHKTSWVPFADGVALADELEVFGLYELSPPALRPTSRR